MTAGATIKHMLMHAFGCILAAQLSEDTHGEGFGTCAIL